MSFLFFKLIVTVINLRPQKRLDENFTIFEKIYNVFVKNFALLN